MTSITKSDIAMPAMREIGSSWGWFVALGVLFIVLGAIAFSNLPAATTASVYAVGVLMLIGAISQLAGAFYARSWSGFGLLLLSALLYGAAGAIVIANPMLGAWVLTLMLGASLIASGVMRIWWSLALRELPGWGWITASGVVTLLAGIVFVAGWPTNSVYLLGMVLAVDLAFQGAMTIGCGFALKKLAK
ncbi:MAG TPA: HdeD family acid-resistance protein [Burkholderiales bacterium]|nr:HdeD family acid-resistance protein [Burkholderiales bacterium]